DSASSTICASVTSSRPSRCRRSRATDPSSRLSHRSTPVVAHGSGRSRKGSAGADSIAQRPAGRRTGSGPDTTDRHHGTPDARPGLESTGEALESAKGFIRSEVGKGLTIRLTPSLEFIADAVPEAAARLDGLLAQAAADDERVAGLAKNARPAGEADPYKRNDEDGDDD